MQLEKRQKILESALGGDAENVLNHIQKSSTSISSGSPSLIPADASQWNLPPNVLDRANFADDLARLAGDHVPLATAILGDESVKSMRDVALHYGSVKFARAAMNQDETAIHPELGRALLAVQPSAAAPGDSATTSNPEAVALGTQRQTRIFHAEPSAVLQRMVAENDISVHPAQLVRDGVVKFLNDNPSFNIRQTSVLVPLGAPGEPGSAIGPHEDPTVRGNIIESLKTLQPTDGIAENPSSLP